MRLLLSVLSIVLYTGLFAQVQDVKFTNEHTPAKRLRIGISYHTDIKHANPYLRSDFLILPRVRRANALLFTTDYQISRNSRALRLRAEVGHYHVVAGNDDPRWLNANGWRRQRFSERIETNYLHLGLGLRFEPYGKEKFSPLIGMQLQMALPSDINYLYQDFAGVGFDPQVELEINGGERATLGWKLDVGFRYQFNERLTASFTYYYAFMNFKANWPDIEQRQFTDAIMRLASGGIELGCLYSI